MTAPEYVAVGRVRKAHGIRGEVVVEPITDGPEAVFASGRRLFVGSVTGTLGAEASPVTIVRASRFKGGWIVTFDALATRTDAELWRDRYLLLPADELPLPGEDEVYFHDLVGMEVELVSGQPLGAVGEVYELPQGILLDVTTARGSVMLPYRPDVITEVDVAARRIRVDPPAGLLE